MLLTIKEQSCNTSEYQLSAESPSIEGFFVVLKKKSLLTISTLTSIYKTLLRVSCSLFPYIVEG
jgi:hypothetical protein